LKSYIKIFGPPVLKAIKELEKIALNMPEVCIMDTIIATNMHQFDTRERKMDFFSEIGEITVERCDKIISKSAETLGEHDFYFEWFIEPNKEQLHDLLDRIDIALIPLGCNYTITTRGIGRKPEEFFVPERQIILQKSELEEALKGKISFNGVSSEDLIFIRESFEKLINLKSEAKGVSLKKEIKDQIINLFLLIVKKTGESL